MLVDGFGDVTISNDGATILDEMDVQNPAAKMMVEVAKTQDDEVGDGTTSAVILAGELLSKAQALIDKDVHPTVVVDGYQSAGEKALELLRKMAIKVNPTDRVMLRKVAKVRLQASFLRSTKNTLPILRLTLFYKSLKNQEPSTEQTLTTLRSRRSQEAP